jgi:raffinose/stachyose/melibiose transport system substrate-binding protein
MEFNGGIAIEFIKNKEEISIMKKIIALLLMLVLVVTMMVGCGSNQQTNSETSGQPTAKVSESTTTAAAATASDEKIVIKVFHYMLQTTKQGGLKALEEAYTKLNPNITFENIFYNQGTDYFPQLSTALASGELPEIIMGNPGLYPDVVAGGYAMDLTQNKVIKSLGLKPGDTGDVSANGVVYGFPIDFKTWGVFYNVKMFKDLGLSVPTTQTELMNVCKKIADAGKDPWIHAFGDAVFGDIEMRNTVWGRAIENGDIDFFEKLMTGKAKFTDYPYVLEGLKVWQQRMQWYRSDAMANNQSKSLELFVAGEGAMLYNGSWSIGDLMAKAGKDFKFDFFLAPVDDKPNSTLMGSQIDQSFMVNPKAENADAALAFMEFWITDGALVWSNTSLMPLASSASSDDLPAVVNSISAIKKSGKVACYGDFTKPFSSEFTTKWRQALTEFAESCVTGGKMTPEKCLENLQAYFDDVIATSK